MDYVISILILDVSAVLVTMLLIAASAVLTYTPERDAQKQKRIERE